MDNSKTYIKMCDCQEIQKLSPRKRYTTDLYSLDGEISTYDQYRQDEVYYNAIWLPRQDQLQEMLNYGMTELVCGLFIFYKDNNTFEINLDGYPRSFTSMEQLWLAFVMKERFNKTWDGEKWTLNIQQIQEA